MSLAPIFEIGISGSRAEVRVEPAVSEHARGLADAVARELEDALGAALPVRMLARGDLTRSAGKARRIVREG